MDCFVRPRSARDRPRRGAGLRGPGPGRPSIDIQFIRSPRDARPPIDTPSKPFIDINKQPLCSTFLEEQLNATRQELRRLFRKILTY